MTPISIPFKTDRTELAIILEMLGEKRLDMRNTYSEQRLQMLGCSTVKEAMSRDKAGKVEYLFEQSSQIQKIVIAYYDQIRRNELCIPSPKPNLTDAELTRFAVSVLMMRKAYVSLWKSASVFIGNEPEVKSELEKHKITKEDLEANGGKIFWNGVEYFEGDEILMGGTVTYGPVKTVSVRIPAELRGEAGL